MLSSELGQVIADVRSAVALQQEWRMMNSVPQGVSGAIEFDVPAEYLELLRITDGPIFGGIVLYDAKRIEKYQFYADEDEGALVRLGREMWFFFGLVNEDPIFINRQDGSVWGFPDRGIVWQDSDAFEQFADGVGDFLEKYAFGQGYRSLVGVDEDDQWWRLLRHIGRV
jgi:hypothetical protein